MYNLPTKIVLVNATSGISDVYFLDSTEDKNPYVKLLDSTITNNSLSLIERYFPQRSQVIFISDKEDPKDYPSLSKDSKKYTIGILNEESSLKFLSNIGTEDAIYLDIDYKKIKIYRLTKLDNAKKVKVSIFEEEYTNRLLKLIQNADDNLIKDNFFSEVLNDFKNSEIYNKKYKSSGYIIACLLRQILSISKVEKELDIKSFGKSNKSNPCLIIGGDAVKFFSVDSILLAFSQALLNVTGFNIYSDYSHLILAGLSQSGKDPLMNSLVDKYVKSSYIGRYINLMNNSPLQKIYASIKIKEGIETRDLFGITGTYLEYDFHEEATASFEILGDGKKEKIIKNLDYTSLSGSLVVNFINPKQNIEDSMRQKDFMNYLNWENNLKN